MNQEDIEVLRDNELIRSVMPEGSNVSGTIDKDHKKYGEWFLKSEGWDDEWQVVVADDSTLMLDFDTPYTGTIPSEKFATQLELLKQQTGNVGVSLFPSKGGNTHVIIKMPLYNMPVLERIAWQAVLGSDPKREALHLLSVHKNELNPVLLFMKKY